ncbi:MAG: hypothetical protein WC707_00940 [Candidatus Babeliaceae bacterium]|jgi:hypothetical protein
MKRFLFFIFFLTAQLVGHGFGPHTLVKTGDVWQSIEQLCNNISEHQCVTSYTIHAGTYTHKKIKSAGTSTTNCYFRIGFDEQFNDDIICTPSQKFYVPAVQKWVPAYQLTVGDQLLGADKKLCPITHIEFVKKTLTVYSLGVTRPHNFLVGRHAIVTHNMFFPVAFHLGFSMAFGSGAVAGGTAGSFLGPLTIIGGAAIGGVIGIAMKMIPRKNKLSHYELVFHANTIEKHFIYNADQKNNSGEVSFTNIPQSCSASPGDPNDPEDPRNKKPKKDDKDHKNDERKKNTPEKRDNSAHNAAQYEKLKIDLRIKEFTSIIKVTAHGIKRLIERGFTPEEVKEAITTPTLTKLQADGSKAYIRQIGANYNVIVINECMEEVITALKNIDKKALCNLGKNYGWQ